MIILLLRTGFAHSPPYTFYTHYRVGNGFVATGFRDNIEQAHRFNSVADAVAVADQLCLRAGYRFLHVHVIKTENLRTCQTIINLAKVVAKYA